MAAHNRTKKPPPVPPLNRRAGVSQPGGADSGLKLLCIVALLSDDRFCHNPAADGAGQHTSSGARASCAVPGMSDRPDRQAPIGIHAGALPGMHREAAQCPAAGTAGDPPRRATGRSTDPLSGLPTRQGDPDSGERRHRALLPGLPQHAQTCGAAGAARRHRVPVPRMRCRLDHGAAGGGCAPAVRGVSEGPEAENTASAAHPGASDDRLAQGMRESQDKRDDLSVGDLWRFQEVRAARFISCPGRLIIPGAIPPRATVSCLSRCP